MISSRRTAADRVDAHAARLRRGARQVVQSALAHPDPPVRRRLLDAAGSARTRADSVARHAHRLRHGRA